MEETEADKQQAAILSAIGKATDFSELVGFYVDFRDQIEAIKRELAERTAPLSARMDRIEARLLERLSETGQENAKTTFGTAYKKPFTSTKVADWNVLLDYIKKNDAYDLLTKSVAKDAVKARIEETGEIVPGVDLVTGVSVGVRRS